MRAILYFLYGVLFTTPLFAGAQIRVDHTYNDSLVHVLKTAPPDTQKVYTYYRLIQGLCDIDANMALRYAAEMSHLSDSLGFKKGKAKSLNAYGNLYLNLGDYRKALFSFLQSFRIYELLADTPGMAAISTGIGNVYSRVKKAKTGQEYYELSLRLYQRTSNLAALGQTYSNLAGVYVSQNEYQKALKYYDTALVIAAQCNNTYGQCLIWASMGHSYSKMGDFTSAEMYLHKAIGEGCNNHHIQASAEESLGSIYLRTHKWDEALKHFKRSKQLAQTAGIDYILADVYKGISEIHKEKGEYKEALLNYTQYIEWREAAISSDKLQKINELQSAYDLERKDRQIETLDNAKKMAELQSGKDRLYRNSFIVAFILALIISLAFIRNAYLKQKVNRILKENNIALNDKNKQIELQKNKIEKINAELDRHNKEVVKENIIAKYEILKGKTNPHFLFNSLTSLSALVIRDKDSALEFIENFSELYRMILEMGENRLITLKQEMALVNNYLYLEKARFRDNLHIIINIPEHLNEMVLPSFAIQICVENALKHNAVSEAQNLTLSIESKDNRVVVKNNLQPKNTGVPSTGTGQKNIVERYRLISNITPVFSAAGSEYLAELPLLPKNHKL